jgi:hypothetical protein
MHRPVRLLGRIKDALSDRRVQRIGIILVFAFAVAVALTIVGLVLSSQRSDLWLEVAKAGLQLGVIVLVGGAVTYGFNFLESERATDVHHDEYRLGVIRNLIESYNRIKSARRTLRAYGFRKPQVPRPNAQQFTAEQVDAYRKQMLVLVEAQLKLEEISREIKAQPQVFKHSKALEVLIHTGESYVNKVIEEWEKCGVDVVTGAHAGHTTDVFDHLQNFLGDPGAQVGGIKTISKPIEEIQRLIQGQFLGANGTDVPFYRQHVDLGDQGEPSKLKEMFDKDPAVIAYDTKRQQGQIVARVYLDPKLDCERKNAAICKFGLVIQPPSD